MGILAAGASRRGKDFTWETGCPRKQKIRIRAIVMAHHRRGILKIVIYLSTLLLLVLVSVGIFVIMKLRASLPIRDGERQIEGLDSPVTITSDRFGIPTITAQTRRDAALALGYVTARDRLFQMDLLRRRAAGRLSEILGNVAIETDKRQRVIGFNRVAPKIVAHLPNEQKEILAAYADGVNAFIKQMGTAPMEFLLLRYRPEPWKAEDTILVALNMFQTLSFSDDEERMMSIMEKSLPPEVVAFLTPDTDSYTQTLLGGADSHRPIQPIPVEALASIRQDPKRNGARAKLVQPTELGEGSNNWAVDGSKTSDGRAIVANDTHLSLSVPNVWYRAALRYGGIETAGVFLPGVPAVIIGSNGHVAWGFTNIGGDFLDLVQLEINPADPDEYKTPNGWKRFEVVEEQIKIKGGEHVLHPVKLTTWGPVSPTPLMGVQVAIHATAQQPDAVDVGLLEMDQAKTLEDALSVMNHFGAPPQNVVAADVNGRVGWTYCGRIPIRKGFDGATTKSWADGSNGWNGYIPPSELPRIVNPPDGFLVTANNRTLGKNYPYTIGHNFANSYRAYRITERLNAMERVTEQDMFQLQLDTRCDFYDFYRQLALSVLTDSVIADNPHLLKARKHLAAWDGKVEVDSVAFGLLVRFRKILAGDVFEPFLALCQEADGNFLYTWRTMDVPLQMLLTEKIAETLPDPVHYQNWDEFILSKLDQSIDQLCSEYSCKSLDQVTWGKIHRPRISHPLGFIPVLGRFLNMPQSPLPGSDGCVRSPRASERMAVSPGHHADGILHIPCGQSGHPLSKNYKDQHGYWVRGESLPFLSGHTTHTLTLKPNP